MIPLKYLTIFTAFLIGSIHYAQAVLTLHIDTGPNLYYLLLSGSDTGILNSSSDVFWSNENSTSSDDSQSSGAPVVTESEAGYTYNAAFAGGKTSGEGIFGILGAGHDSASITFTGAGIGVKGTYNGLDATNQGRFESMIGQNIALVTALGSSGWSDLTVVPEPETYGLAFAFLMISMVHFRKRKIARLAIPLS